MTYSKKEREAAMRRLTVDLDTGHVSEDKFFREQALITNGDDRSEYLRAANRSMTERAFSGDSRATTRLVKRVVAGVAALVVGLGVLSAVTGDDDDDDSPDVQQVQPAPQQAQPQAVPQDDDDFEDDDFEGGDDD